MLVLTRRINESILLGEKGELVLKVLSINGHQVRLGIEAPRNLPVHREEVFLKIHGKNNNAQEQC